MIIKISVLILSVLNGAWMIFDGVHVLRHGQYFGPPQPGGWSKLPTALGINPFSLGPLFIILGALWLISVTALLLSSAWGWLALLLTAIATLWYIKVGTAIALIVIALLLLFKTSLGYA